MKTLGYLLLMFFVLGLGGYMGYMMGVKDELGIAQDRKALEITRLPKARYSTEIDKGKLPKSVDRHGTWVLISLENKLECVVAKMPDRAWGSCNWEKWNAEKKEGS